MNSEQINELTAALAKAQGQMAPARHNRQVTINTDRGTREWTYADLAAIIEAVRKPLSENGLAFVQIEELEPSPVLVTTLFHSSGQWITTRHALPVGNITPQQFGSALTYARRYSLSTLLGVAADEDDDAELASNGPAVVAGEPGAVAKGVITVEQLATLEAALKVREVPAARVLAYVAAKTGKAVATLAEVPADLFEGIIGKVRNTPAAEEPAADGQTDA